MSFKDVLAGMGLADKEDNDDMYEEKDGDERDSFDSDSHMEYDSSQAVAAPYKYSRTDMARIVTFHPKEYAEAYQIGDALKAGIPVILNLTDVSEAIAFRITDFSSGVVYGLSGAIQRVTPRVFVLTPQNVEIDRQIASQRDGRAFFE